MTTALWTVYLTVAIGLSFFELKAIWHADRIVEKPMLSFFRTVITALLWAIWYMYYLH